MTALVLVRAIGALVLCVLAAVVWMGLGKPVKKIPTPSNSKDGSGEERKGDRCEPQKPILAMELLKTARQGLQLLGEPPVPGNPENEQRSAMRDQMHRDFLFIVAYGLLFTAMSLLLSLRAFRGAVWLGVVAGLCSVAAALFDVRENLNVLHFLSLPVPDDASALAIRHASLLKWGLTSVALLALSVLFFGRDHRPLTLIGVLFVATAAIGLAGLSCNRLLQSFFLPLAPALLATGGIAFCFPDWLV